MASHHRFSWHGSAQWEADAQSRHVLVDARDYRSNIADHAMGSVDAGNFTDWRTVSYQPSTPAGKLAYQKFLNSRQPPQQMITTRTPLGKAKAFLPAAGDGKHQESDQFLALQEVSTEEEESTEDSQGPASDDDVYSSDEGHDLPVKSTFIHFKSNEFYEESMPPLLGRSNSAPAIVAARPFTLKYTPAMVVSHERGDCRPCAYFLVKQDGCRWGADCEFCHLCPPTEIKKRKKEKAKALKAEVRADWHRSRAHKTIPYWGPDGRHNASTWRRHTLGHY